MNERPVIPVWNRRQDAASPAAKLAAAAAFTLMELMIVLVLMAIMAAMIVPEMKGTYEHELLRSTSRQLIRACQLASSQSVTVQLRHRVRINSRDGRFTVERWAASQESMPGFLALTDVADGSGQLDGRVNVEIRPPTGEGFLFPDPELPPESPAGEEDTWSISEAILFYPDGRAEAKEFLLRDRQGFELALRVNPVNGRVQIQEKGNR